MIFLNFYSFVSHFLSYNLQKFGQVLLLSQIIRSCYTWRAKRSRHAHRICSKESSDVKRNENIHELTHLYDYQTNLKGKWNSSSLPTSCHLRAMQVNLCFRCQKYLTLYYTYCMATTCRYNICNNYESPNSDWKQIKSI